jgi:iron-sulfur cluster assembly protein
VLEMTKTAIDTINHFAPGDAGLRVSMSDGDPETDALRIEIADAPGADDQVVEAGGAHVFLEPRAADTLDDKVLDAVQDERGVHFAVRHQHLPGSAPGEAGSGT